MRNQILYLSLSCFLCLSLGLSAQVGHEGNLGDRIDHADVANGSMSLKQIRTEGLRIFSTPFNALDGFGEVYDVNDPDHVQLGNRPTLQNNGTFLRVNGLDGQTCLECHTITSNATIPADLGIGGVGGISASPMFMPSEIDVDDSADNGFAFFNGRLINPPFLFGAGGIEAVGKEMTSDLQALKAEAMANPNTVIDLDTHGVHFGTISFDGTDFDCSGVEGVEHDLVVRPFGRKGENFTTRDFDRGAVKFHMGMDPNEVVGEDFDNDGDGVENEVTVGELSVLHIFANTNQRPVIRPRFGSFQGLQIFFEAGCAECHKPTLQTESKVHTFSFPDVGDDPSANIYTSIRLDKKPLRFSRNFSGGVNVNCFADLKRHDMGPGLAESFGAPVDAEFTTARLWGIADTAPYLHDGRALTLSDAILAHGGEAQQARDNFANLSNGNKLALLALLRSLRTPSNPNTDLKLRNKDVNN